LAPLEIRSHFLDPQTHLSESCKMTQHLLSVRVRPARITILINNHADRQALLFVIEFCSKVWGGRFVQILSVDPNVCDPLTEFRLGKSRPEFVYGVGVNDEVWAAAATRSCQPRGYGQLKSDFVKGIKQAHREEYILVDHALIDLAEKQARRASHKRKLRLITINESKNLAACCAAVFGLHHANLRKEFFDCDSTFESENVADFIALVTEFVTNRQQCWLDVTGHELNVHLQEFGFLVPTIVLVGNEVPDLALFWNLRSTTDPMTPAWIIPVPLTVGTDALALERLKDWLLAFLPYGERPNHCVVTSQSVSESACREFADQLLPALSGSPIKMVDYQRPKNSLPTVVAYEYETIWPVGIKRRHLTFQPPRPRAFGENLGNSRSWIVDLIKDVRTGRAVKDLQLPPNPVVSELLNGPCPPTFEFSAIRRTGDGTDCINVRCSGSKEVLKLFLPTSEEILGEILREHGIELVHDEKRSSYLPVIRRFGGLHLACLALSSQSGSILQALADGPKTLEEIKGACQLGSGTLSGESYVQQVEKTFPNQNERMNRLVRRRFLQYAKRSTPEVLTLPFLLEYWADRAIVTRHWRIGPCRRCKQKYFVSDLDIQRRIVCTNCGHRISLPSKLPIGYSLHRAVQHAIAEGVIPVALTGRFLRGLTSNGFFWLPGVKFREGNSRGDIDILACCDGHLVLAECKCLRNTPGEVVKWDTILTQFLGTVAIAKRCKASLVVLAALVDSYPESLQSQIAAEIGDTIPYLLLNKVDLETGHKESNKNGRRWLRISNVIDYRFELAPSGGGW